MRLKKLSLERISLFHSDRGVQYASNYFRKVLNTNEFIQSVSEKGNCYDNVHRTRFIEARVPGIVL
ncbi:IS1236 transposase domain protein [Leptospira weilii str. 2006001853]|uniref:IS1236 transposase domain protein n=2 Tax=Leptospira weilii TaxID=28184 RepID=A0A828YWV7_9LEPT|nr:IS1236 transposase domain protein [Leptospira weilii str. 2006001853]EMM71179.1 IS1236 transposase domain protein [Leptospira weilii str. 2006001855]EMN42585.1 IS1236 transposase domain protein [Leptospira weilii str. LNT 1234]OMI18144.1 transposase [Leptospira weilii serovar Heyan]